MTMKKTIFKGKYKEHDLTVNVTESRVVDGLIGAIEKAALAQVPLSPRLLQQFCELRDVGFFTLFDGVCKPQTGGIEPCQLRYERYSHSLLEKVNSLSPAWLIHSKNSKNQKDTYEDFITKWSCLYVNSCGERSHYHLNRLVYDLVTTNGDIFIPGYHALTPIEVLEKILPDKYKAKKAS
jgi:hypothetical protein